MKNTIFGLLFLLVWSDLWAFECPVKTKLDPKLYTLTNDMFYELDPNWKEPFQTSGFTKTDFTPLTSFAIDKKGSNYIINYPKRTLTHQIYIRPEKVKNKKNPRWNSIKDFPCSQDFQKNFVTYQCTVTHEKVHVVLRDDAIKELCPAFMKELNAVKEKSEVEAKEQALKIIKRFIATVSQKDNEKVPYHVEWDCITKKAKKAGIVCQTEPKWNEFDFLKGLEQRKSKNKVEFYGNKGQKLFTALKMGSSYQIKSTGEFEGCAQKSWYLDYAKLNQINCKFPNYALRKTFYLFGKKQREVFIEQGEVISEKLFYDPRKRLMHD